MNVLRLFLGDTLLERDTPLKQEALIYVDTLLEGTRYQRGNALTDEDTLIEEDTLMVVKIQWFAVCCSARL